MNELLYKLLKGKEYMFFMVLSLLSAAEFFSNRCRLLPYDLFARIPRFTPPQAARKIKQMPHITMETSFFHDSICRGYPPSQWNLGKSPMLRSVQSQKNHFLVNGFWHTRRRWSLPFCRSITLASQRICVANMRAFSMGPNVSERIIQPYQEFVFKCQNMYKQ